jgi:signal transduction histidine kinase
MRLRSLVVGTLLATVLILGISFLAFQAIATRMQRITIDPLFSQFDELQLESARDAYEEGGTKALTAYMDRLNRIFTGKHFLLDANGTDMITGENRSILLPPPPATVSRINSHGHWLIAHRSSDGKYWFAAVGHLGRLHMWTFLPYYFLVIGASALLCWIAAAGVIFPIRRIAQKIAVFGRGDLSVRVATSRPDEIGQLARSFNQMAERLERSIVSERRLLADISHELRSPLARLKFAVKLARTAPDWNTALDRIERDVNRMTSLVSDIVEITVLEGDPALAPVEFVLLDNLIRETVRDCAMEAEGRNCRIDIDGSVAGRVRGNRELLRRAVENVLRNAIRYSPEEGSIFVSMMERDGHAQVEVRDHGPGVPEESLTRIFSPFVRVEQARTANGGGSGLGLSIAMRAVQAHHGSIVAENASPGLRVRITLPIAPDKR